MKDLQNEEKDLYYKWKHIIAFAALGCFAFGSYDRANFLVLLLIFLNTIKR